MVNNFVFRFDPNKCLPPELTVELVDDILYRIGLSYDSVRDRPKRKRIDHPLIAFIIVLLFFIKNLITTSLSDENEIVFRVLGDVGNFLGVRRFFGFSFVLFSFFPLFSQLIYYYNYRNGIKPTFLRVFQMMSGLVSPQSVGLTECRRNYKTS